MNEPAGEPCVWGDSNVLLRIHGGGAAGALPYLVGAFQDGGRLEVSACRVGWRREAGTMWGKIFQGLALVIAITWGAPALLPADPKPPRALERTGPSQQELFFGTLRRCAAWWDASRPNPPLVDADLEILSTAGLPAGLVGQRFHYTWRCPDRAQLQGKIGQESFTVGRDRDELWLWRPQKALVWRARSTADDPLGSLSLPLMGVWLPQLPSLFAVRRQPGAVVSGIRCDVLLGTTQPEARQLLGLPGLQLTLWLGERDHRLHRFRWEVPAEGQAITMAVRQLRERPLSEAPRWQAPSSGTNRVERVPLPRLRGAFPDSFHEMGVLRWLAP